MTPMVGVRGMLTLVRGSGGGDAGPAFDLGGLQFGFGARIRVR